MTFWQAVVQILIWIVYGFIVLVEINDIIMWFDGLKGSRDFSLGGVVVGLGCRVFIVIIIVKYLFMR